MTSFELGDLTIWVGLKDKNVPVLVHKENGEWLCTPYMCDENEEAVEAEEAALRLIDVLKTQLPNEMQGTLAWDKIRPETEQIPKKKKRRRA